jgi:hypothetical protein
MLSRWAGKWDWALRATGRALLVTAISMAQMWAQDCIAQPDLPQTGSVHGVVMNREGSVYEGAQVSFAGGGATRVTNSDSNGRFRFAEVSAGDFTLTVTAPGFRPQMVSGTLRAGESLEMSPAVLSMSAATAEVRVTASRYDIAQQQLKDEEQQRILGVFPNFNVVYAKNASPLSRGQKFQLAFRMSVDPLTFLGTGATAGMEQASNSFKGYGQGAAGYARRFGAAYGDNVIGTFIGTAILPAMLKQDPRYFYKGAGSKRSRVLYAIVNTVVCKSDNGRWQPNYSNLIADFGIGEIANLYYPAGDRNNVKTLFTAIGIGKLTAAGENIFEEFFSRRMTPKLPGYSKGT